jgi:hypothetical protein
LLVKEKPISASEMRKKRLAYGKKVNLMNFASKTVPTPSTSLIGECSSVPAAPRIEDLKMGQKNENCSFMHSHSHLPKLTAILYLSISFFLFVERDSLFSEAEQKKSASCTNEKMKTMMPKSFYQDSLPDFKRQNFNVAFALWFTALGYHANSYYQLREQIWRLLPENIKESWSSALCNLRADYQELARLAKIDEKTIYEKFLKQYRTIQCRKLRINKSNYN